MVTPMSGVASRYVPLAQFIRRFGLQVPALFFIKATRPIHFLLGQVEVMFSPLPLKTAAESDRQPGLFGDPQQVGLLIMWLEDGMDSEQVK